MKRNVLSFVNRLQSYKTAIKNLHWSSKHMSEHKLWDDIADSVANVQDEVAEIAQGLFGKIKPNELKPRRYNITNSKKTLNDILKDTKLFYSTIKRGDTFVGIRSSVEAFIGELEKFQYLMDMCIKEDIKRNIKNSLNENNYKSPYHRLQAALSAKGVSNDKRHNELNKFFAKSQALKDINAEIAKDNEKNPHNRQFNKHINLDTFNTDFNVLDDDFNQYNFDDYEPYEVKSDHSTIKSREMPRVTLNTGTTANMQDILYFDNDEHYRKNKEQNKYLESKQPTSNKIKLTENQLRNLIREAIYNVLDDKNIKQIEKDASWDAFERTRQPKSKYSIQGNLDTYLDDKDSWYEFGKDKYDDVMDSDRSYEDKVDDFMDDYHEFSKEDDGFNGMQAQKSEPFYKSYYQDRYDKSKQKIRDLENYI